MLSPRKIVLSILGCLYKVMKKSMMSHIVWVWNGQNGGSLLELYLIRRDHIKLGNFYKVMVRSTLLYGWSVAPLRNLMFR